MTADEDIERLIAQRWARKHLGFTYYETNRSHAKKKKPGSMTAAERQANRRRRIREAKR